MNDFSDFDNVFRIKLVSNTSILCKSLHSQVSSLFTYPPDLHSVVNAALLTGSFSPVSAAKHFRSTNSPNQSLDFEDIRIRLYPDALLFCRNFQKSVGRFFPFKPDIHAVVNSLLATGHFDIKSIANFIYKSYADVDIDAIAAQDSLDSQDNPPAQA
jgi:hypothetical protein